ncbi:MAG: hypothetical protein GF334_07390 [Candidatus Altiarchaeales archaeon]|nr:hypothetical protein [Candidatus Altiarchaeales archaeon]
MGNVEKRLDKQTNNAGGEVLPSVWTHILPVEKKAYKNAVDYVSEGLRNLKGKRRYSISGERRFSDPHHSTAHAMPPTSMEKGYDERVRQLDVTIHPTLNVTNFLELEFSAPLAQIIKGGAVVELHRGNVGETMKSLRERGCTSYRDIKTPWGPPMFLAQKPDNTGYVLAMANMHGKNYRLHYQALLKYLGVKPSNIHNYSYDYDYKGKIIGNLEKMQTPADEALIGGLWLGKRIQHRLQTQDKYRHLTQHLKQFRQEGEENLTLNKIMLKRLGEEATRGDADQHPQVVHSRQHKRVLSKLKPLLDTPQADKLFSTSVEQLFHNGPMIGLMDRIAQEIEKLKNSNPKVRLLPDREIKQKPSDKSKQYAFPKEKRYLKTESEYPLRIASMRYTDSGGGERTIIFTEVPYGDMSRDVTKAILSSAPDIEKIVFIGSAGSLRGIEEKEPEEAQQTAYLENTNIPPQLWEKAFKQPAGQSVDRIHLSDICIPMNLYDIRGELVNPTTENRLLWFLEEDIQNQLTHDGAKPADIHNPGVFATEHRVTESPLMEHDIQVDSWRRGGYCGVDCESSYVVEVLEEEASKIDGKKPEFAAMMYIEDVVGVPGFSLGEVDRQKMLSSTRTKMIDILLGGPTGSQKGAYLDIQKISPHENKKQTE